MVKSKGGDGQHNKPSPEEKTSIKLIHDTHRRVKWLAFHREQKIVDLVDEILRGYLDRLEVSGTGPPTTRQPLNEARVRAFLMAGDKGLQKRILDELHEAVERESQADPKTKPS